MYRLALARAHSCVTRGKSLAVQLDNATLIDLLCRSEDGVTAENSVLDETVRTLILCDTEDAKDSFGTSATNSVGIDPARTG